jgi:hypothetical protein
MHSQAEQAIFECSQAILGLFWAYSRAFALTSRDVLEGATIRPEVPRLTRQFSGVMDE